MMDDNDNEQHFVGLLTEVQVPLRLYVSSLMPGDPGAKDVAQNANATLWRKRGEYESGTFFKAWAFSVARYEVLNYRKKKARESRLVFGEDLENTFAEELGDHTDDLEQRHDALKHCLEKLRPSHRELLLHRYSSEGTLKDFSEKTGNSIGGLKVTLHRLRNSLQGCIEKKLTTGEINP